ncbi:hypothetical protein EDB85DRAFT_2184246 [Lactarius pseudohatsudake]|nr:hypothetical protein EDB85DRAFT_2184246 [Lactarius pseudohatsudake]
MDIDNNDNDQQDDLATPFTYSSEARTSCKTSRTSPRADTLSLPTVSVAASSPGPSVMFTPTPAFPPRPRLRFFAPGLPSTPGVASRIRWRVYSLKDGSEPKAVTLAEVPFRYANFDVHPIHRHFLAAVLEDHTNDDPTAVVNTLVVINTKTQSLTTIASGADFYAAPMRRRPG